MQKTGTGFTYTSAAPNTWQHKDSIDVVYGHSASHRGWTYSVCPVSSIADGTVTMNNSCHANVAGINQTTVPTAVENNYALLSSPGQFYHDTSAGTIYYIPQEGQDMRTATVIAGKLQTLVELGGTPDSPVEHMRFTGLKFEHATWLFGEQGLADLQANVLFTETQDPSAHTKPLPANVACHSCDDVTFNGNTFTHLGGGGLGFDGGGHDNTVTGNVFTDIASNGIQIGDGTNYTPPATLESGYTVSDNYVHNVATEYHGGVGILATWVKHTKITHNEVWDTPYTGISLGWGWGAATSQPMVDNHVDSNYVHDVMTSALEDGGPIYVVGTQGATPPSTMTGNHVENDSQRYAALYMDQGSSYWHVEYNVVNGYAPAWLFVQSMALPVAEHNTVQNNYASADAGGIYTTPPGTNTVSNNTTAVAEGNWNAEAKSIMASAGLEPEYTWIRKGGQRRNLAYARPATASSTYSAQYAPSQASNDRITTPGNGPYSAPFASAMDDTSAWWQVDLGASYPLSKIQILFRQDGVDNPAERQDLQIWVSNFPGISHDHTIACSIGAMPLPYQSSYNCPAPLGIWRYVTVTKPGHLVLGQVRVFGATTITPDPCSQGEDQPAPPACAAGASNQQAISNCPPTSATCLQRLAGTGTGTLQLIARARSDSADFEQKARDTDPDTAAHDLCPIATSITSHSQAAAFRFPPSWWYC